MSNAVKHLAGILPDTTPILLVHNGMGTVRGAARRETAVAAGLHDPGGAARWECHHPRCPGHHAYRTGKSYEGDYSYLAEVLQSVLPDVARHNNIHSAIWRKLAVNCVINPLTALKGCKNGDLRDYTQEVAAICREVAAVMEREGIHTSAENLLFYVEQVIESTAEISLPCCRTFAPSVYRDRLHHRFSAQPAPARPRRRCTGKRPLI
ncbi:hypothetical protein LNP74_03040 [Klebsiella pneumoniae subsp. pneumoniae]|nr:hypothetical protein [Klebsiella pneumoniae subsp. pneumoniae]